MTETEAKPLVCRACGARLRMRPGWLLKLGVWANTITLVGVLFIPVVAHSRRSRVALGLSGIVAAIVLYAVFAPAEKAAGNQQP